jgi:hypothetical protein
VSGPYHELSQFLKLISAASSIRPTYNPHYSAFRHSTESGFPTVTMPSEQPPTPLSEPGSGMSSRASTIRPHSPRPHSPQSTPLKRKREKPIFISNDGVLKEEPYFLDDQAMQRVADLLTQNKAINDDCINRVLEVFSPDPTAWYVASTHLIPLGDHSEAAPPKHKDFLGDPQRKLLFPLHLPSMSHWTLVTFDRKHKHCLVYDPMGSKNCNELASRTVQKFLNGHGLWDGEVTIDSDPFPFVRQTDGVNCGIFVIAVGLQLLHDRPVRPVTPKLWRELLTAYFCTKSEPPRGWITSYLANRARSADSGRAPTATIERKIEDAEAVNAATSDVKACIEEIRLLLDLVDVQTSKLEKREQERDKLIEMRRWCLSMPAYADRFMTGVVAARGDLATAQLKSLPRMINGGVRQLGILKKSCFRAINDCEQVSSTLEQRGNDLRDIAMVAYHDFGSKLAALEK